MAASETISILATSGSAASDLRGSRASILSLMTALCSSVRPLVRWRCQPQNRGDDSIQRDHLRVADIMVA